MGIINNIKSSKKNVYKKSKQKFLPYSSKSKSTLKEKSKNINTRNTNIHNEIKNVVYKISIFIIFIFVLALFYYGIISAIKKAKSSEYFNITEIEVIGNVNFSLKEIINLSGLELNKNSLVYNIDEIKNNILNSAWVDTVNIKRELPNKFSIDIEERIALYIIVKDNVLYYIDKQGHFIEPVSHTKTFNLPILYLEIETLEMFNELINFTEILNTIEFPFDTKNISWVSISEKENFELYWEKEQLLIRVSIENWEVNLTRLALSLIDLEKRNELNKIREVNASGGQVYIRK